MPFSKNPLRQVYDWTLSLAERKLSGLWLGLLSFAEASFFPIPPDVLLLPLCLGNLKKAFFFALICSVASVLGGPVMPLVPLPGMDCLVFPCPGFTEEKFTHCKIGIRSGALCLSSRFFLFPQNFYHC